MKKLLLSLLLIVCSIPAQATLTANVVWETRPGAGSDTLCSGGFDSSQTSPGTDWSQQNAAHVVFNGTTITATTGGATTGILVTGYTVATTDVGNVVQVTGGTSFLPGFYTIVSVMTGALNEWTVDRNVASGVATGMTGAMGGALASLQTALVKTSSPVAVSGNIIWQKGTLTVTAGINVATSNTTLRISVRGYGTTRGDNIQQTITTATNSVNLLIFGSVSGWEFQNLIFSNTAGTNGYGAWANGIPNGITFQNCVFTGFSIGINGNNGSATNEFFDLVLIGTEIKNSTTFGIQQAGTTFISGGSYIHNNGSDGMQLVLTADSPVFDCTDSVFASNTGSGVNSQTSFAGSIGFNMHHCAFYKNTVDGVRIGKAGGAGQGINTQNSVYYGNGGFGINFQGISAGAVTPTVAIQISNAFGSNTARNTGAPAGTSDITLTADPFVNAASANFALNTTAGGGLLLYSSGFPGVTPIGTGFAAVGPLQPAASSGGGQHGYPIVQ